MNVIVIGSGPGGEAAAKRLAERHGAGLRITLIEKAELGGLCLNWGCIPTKALLEPARLAAAARAAGEKLPGADDLRVHWPAIQKHKDSIVSSFRTALARRLNQSGIQVVQGIACFESPDRVCVQTPEGSRSLAFDAAVLATGSAPVFPPPFDALRGSILDSDRALGLEVVPRRLAVVGGGAVGLEFACLFHEVGSAVTVVEKMDQILPGEDTAVVGLLRRTLERRGIGVRTGATITAADKTTEGWSLCLSSGERIEVDDALVCVGRRPAVSGLGLDVAGVRVEGGRIAVDEALRTSNPNIFAVGDANGLSLLAHAASAQGEVAAENILGESRTYDNSLVPRCLYTWPEVASVGEWTHSAQAKGMAAKARRFFFQGSPKALAAGEGEGFIQVVLDEGSHRVLGAQIIGPHATELIHVFSVALRAGMTAGDLRSVMFAHPTLGEGIGLVFAR